MISEVTELLRQCAGNPAVPLLLIGALLLNHVRRVLAIGAVTWLAARKPPHDSETTLSISRRGDVHLSVRRGTPDALEYTADQVFGNSALGRTDIDIIVGNVLDELDREWAVIAAGRPYHQIRALMRHRLQREIGDVVRRQKKVRDGAERAFRRDAASMESDDLEDDYAEQDLRARMRLYIDGLREPLRSVLLRDEDGMRRHGVTKVNARKIRSRWVKQLRRAVAGNDEGFEWLTLC